ncbi:ATP-binding protein [Paenibacillus yanchengensis]|uniref:histidine kinase n=1 Tax=Paenibacillus yanchengensis TaxID=2035833 RepID=A0ABW4YPY3_9BACL
MVMSKDTLHRWKVPMIATAFLFILILSHLLWQWAFKQDDQYVVDQGQLNISTLDYSQKRSILLGGEWEFHPNTWLFPQNIPNHHRNNEQKTQSLPNNKQWMTVPGNWNDDHAVDDQQTVHYGSYRLRLLVDPDRPTNLTIFVPSVRSSSQLFVDGNLIASSGQPASSQADYVARNIPYTATFYTDNKSEIEIVLQAANFTDSRTGGITRPMRIGSEHTINVERQLSLMMHMLVVSIFLIHAVYAIILYFIGYRNKKFLYFSLFILIIVLSLLTAIEEKVLLVWFPLPLNISLNLQIIFLITGAFALNKCMEEALPKFWTKYITPTLSLACLVMLIVTLFIPAQYMFPLQLIVSISIITTFVTGAILLVRRAFHGSQISLGLLLSMIAVTHYFLVFIFILPNHASVIYYPFDLIIATICFSTIWLSRYYRILLETQQLTLKLQQADQQKDQFLTNTSHEIRNPLHSLLTVAQTVLDREQSQISNESVTSLKMVQLIGKRLTIMLDDLIDMSRLPGTNIELNKQPFFVQDISYSLTVMLQHMAGNKPVMLINDIPVHAPAVYGDENRIMQVLYNLTQNALKFTNEGEVQFTSYMVGSHMHIQVRDTGIGIADSDLQRIFQRYEQITDASQEYTGIGLGLFISRQLVELHDSHLKVESTVGKGTEFSFLLPLAEPLTYPDQEVIDRLLHHTEDAIDLHDDEKQFPINLELQLNKKHAQSSQHYKPPHQLPHFHSKSIAPDQSRILLVDDDPINLQVMQSMLEPSGFDLQVAADGKTALQLIQLREWDLIISDVTMPHMSGFELTENIRKLYSITELPILLLTARNRSTDIKNGFLAGANDYVTKPVDTIEFHARIKVLTDMRESFRERMRIEAAWLQAQIQPHFLFNTLNAIAALSTIDLEQMRNLIDVFSQFLRDKFNFQNMQQWISIEDELNIIRSYLYIEQVRFQNKLKVEWHLDDVEPFSIPPLTIQPLVENAVKHGILPLPHAGTIRISLRNYLESVEISISDTGVGMEKSVIEKLLHAYDTLQHDGGIGIINTNLRLQRNFGSGLEITSTVGSGTTVSFIIKKQL